MAKQTPEQLCSFSHHLFEQKYPVLSLWQTLSEHFYPERADFTVRRNVGQELADSLVDSYPVLVRRDLGNSFSAMLRDGDSWFKVGTTGTPDLAGNQWLDFASITLMKMFTTRSANFVRATKEGDHDYATFGQCVISVEPNRRVDGLLFRNWHLRDCAWYDDEAGMVDGVVRKWKPTYHQLMHYFKPEQLHKNITSQAAKTPFKQADIIHLCIGSKMYGDDEIEGSFSHVGIFVDVTNQCIIEETPMNNQMYVVPRFQTIAGSAYAYSPATVVGLPDARSLQAMTHTLLEAGERYARPPIIATQKVVRSDVDLSPDGITWVDNDYDERLGASLRTIPQDRGGFPIGAQMREGIVDVLASAFYLNKITLPDVNRDMTAYEVAERMKQYRRENLPLFAPIEAEYNGMLCETAFAIAKERNMLGSKYDVPESLMDADVEFKFESPLSESEEERKSNQFSLVSRLLSEAAEHDEQVAGNVNFDLALRDAVKGTGAPTKWLHSLDHVLANRKQANQQAAVAQGAALASEVADASMAVDQAGIAP